MTVEHLNQCLALLAEADSILIASNEGILAAHLSAVIEPLRDMLAEHQGAVSGRMIR